MAANTAAYVNIWGQRVGAVAWSESTRTGDFEFEPAFIRHALDLAPVMMPVAQARGRIFSFPQSRDSQTFRGLPGLLADVLPDRYGNTLINSWLASQGRAADSLTPVELLCFIGARGMGALEFEPAVRMSPDTASRIDIDGLVSIAQAILSGRQEFSTNIKRDEKKALTDILKIGTSAGGARAKAVIAYNEKTGEVRSGQATAPVGYSHWLIKLDGVADSQFGASAGYGRVEMAYHRMAVACGIDMMPCRLYEEKDRAHFMTMRFDRSDHGGKIHMQSLCALMHYDFNLITAFSYEQLFQAMRILRLPFPQFEQMYRRMVFNVIARNCDDHTKNFAFLMDPSGEWRISPAYDVCYAYRPGSEWVSRQSLSVNGKRENITTDDLVAVGTGAGVKKALQIANQVIAIVRNWNQYAEEQKVELKLRKSIGKTLLTG